MLFLRDLCDTSSVLKIIQFFLKLVKIIQIVVPIGLIVMVCIELAKNVVASGFDNMKGRVNVALKKVAFAMIIFIIPVIINFVVVFVTEAIKDDEIDFLKCIENANDEYIAKMKAEEDIEREQELNDRLEQNVGDIETDDPYIDGGSSNMSGMGLPDEMEYFPLDGKGENGEYFEYLEVDGHYLTDSEMKEIDNFISESVSKETDWGRRIVTAAWALAYSLSQKNLMLHYQKAGYSVESYTTNTTGIKCLPYGFCKNWGKKLIRSDCVEICNKLDHVNFGGDCNPMKDVYYSGLDCTGLVRWATETGCGVTSSGWGDAPRTTNYDEGVTGDFLRTDSGNHIIIFIRKLDDGTYLTVESNSGSHGGLYFHKYNAQTLRNQGYTLRKMSDRFKEICKVIDY